MAFTDEQNKYITELFVLTNGNVGESINLFYKKFGFYISKTTTIHKWKRQGIKKPPRTNFTGNGLDKEEFIELYDLCGGNLEDMATATNHNLNSIISRCKMYDLDTRDYRSPTKNKNRIEDKYYKLYYLPE